MVVEEVVVVEVAVAVGPQEQAELNLEGLEPQADVKRAGNPVVAVATPWVYVAQKDWAESRRGASFEGKTARKQLRFISIEQKIEQSRGTHLSMLHLVRPAYTPLAR